MQNGAATNNNNISSTPARQVFIGMDVHKESFTLCAYTYEMEDPSHIVKCKANYHLVLQYINSLKKYFGESSQYICGYEAGCLGYTLSRDLKSHNIECHILAPTTMPKNRGKRLKTDSRDSKDIAKCIAYRTCSFVRVPDEEDEKVREYIRMRNSHKKQLKITKQFILAFCLRHNIISPHRNWTDSHILWLRKLELEDIYQEALTEYLITYERLNDTIKRLDNRIAELATLDRYASNIGKLKCFIGIKDYIALAFLAEVGDFNRFKTAGHFASFLGLTPGEHSSGEEQHHLSITKAGNRLLRTLLTESSHCYGRGQIGSKSKALLLRQKGQEPAVIAYADKANERLRRKYKRMMLSGKNGNKVRTAVARELSCFIWGMMTEHIV